MEKVKEIFGASKREEPIAEEVLRRGSSNRYSYNRPQNVDEHVNESSPILGESISLLRNARYYDKLLMYLFLFILLFGMGLGVCLLFLHSKAAIVEEFDYVSREKWVDDDSFLKDLPPLRTPVSKILLLELTPNCTMGGKNCLKSEKFFEHKRKIRIFNGEVPYNFYQDIDGQIYEGRGWSFQSNCGIKEGCDNVLAIGLIEEAASIPSITQIHKLKAFLDYCVMDNALKQCYGILARHSFNRNFEDIVFALNRLIKDDGSCDNFN